MPKEINLNDKDLNLLCICLDIVYDVVINDNLKDDYIKSIVIKDLKNLIIKIKG